MQYPATLLYGETDAPIAKLLGTYELELHESIERALAAQPAAIIDLGAAEGYYAVGLAARCKGIAVHAFELAPTARVACSELAAANYAQLVLHGRATSRRLRAMPLDEAFVVCDIEGAELEVLDGTAARALSTATVLVELHDQYVAGIEGLLRRRFVHHGLTVINSTVRSTVWSELEGFDEKERELAVREWRGREMRWALFEPRTS